MSMVKNEDFKLLAGMLALSIPLKGKTFCSFCGAHHPL